MSHFPRIVLFAIGAILLAACGDEQRPAPGEPVAADARDQQVQDAPTPVMPPAPRMDSQPLSLPNRVAFMAGHVEAGLALYQAGALDMAARHLQHAVSPTHEAERKGLASIGFDGALFGDILKALTDGVPATQVEPQLQAARSNLATMSARAGGNPMAIIDFLMEQVAEKYATGVSNGAVVEVDGYQRAFGFATVAAQRAADLDEAMQAVVTVRLDALLLSWPRAPIPPAKPSPNSIVQKRVTDVRGAFAVSDTTDAS